MRPSLKTSLICLLLAASHAACVADHTVDEWRQNKLNEELEQLRPIAGTYRGTLKSEDEDLGALELAFTPQIRVVAGGPSEKAEGQPVLLARVIFEDRERRFALTAPDSFFDPATGKFEISLSLTRPSGRIEQMTLSGTLWKSGLEGSLEVSGSVTPPARFSLSRDQGASLSEIAEKLSTKPWFAVPGNSAEGAIQFSQGQTRPARLVILEPETTPEEAFLNRFAPLRVVQFSLNFGDSVRLLHEGALWDERLRKLTGRARLVSSKGPNSEGLETLEVYTECTSTEPSAWSCTHQVNGYGATASSSFPQTGVVDPTEPRAGLRFERQGGVRLSQRELNRVWLQVTRPPKSRTEDLIDLFAPTPEKSATVSLQIGLPDSSEFERVAVVFENARIDLRARTLDATTQLRSNIGNGGALMEIRLRCENFVIPALAPVGSPLGESRCRYTSTQLAEPLEILFPEN